MTPVLVMVLAVIEVRQTGLAAALGRATPGPNRADPGSTFGLGDAPTGVE